MNDTHDAIRWRIAWLRHWGAVIRAVPVWTLCCWPALLACEVEAEGLERTLARRAEMAAAKIVDLDAWRRRCTVPGLQRSPRLRRAATSLR
jgi:hypothetical protein